MQNKSNRMLLPIVLAIALALRFVGLEHGFPFIFHPDEPTVIRTALGLRFYPNPGHFDWPHLYMYVNYIMYMVFDNLRKFIVLLGFKATLSKIFPIIWDENLIFYFLSRALTAIFGALTVIPIYAAAREAFGKRVGIIAALSFAIIPFHVWNSSFALIDAPMLFFASWGVFYAISILKRNDTNDYAGGGFYIGLSASTKYNGGLTILTIPFAHLMRVIKNHEKLFDMASLYNLSTTVFTSIIGFLMGTPYAILDYRTFIRTDGPKGALWQFTNVGSVPFNDRIPAFFHQMIYKVADDFGYTFLIGFFIVLVLLIVRKISKKQTDQDIFLWFLTLSGLVFLFYISSFAKSRSQYYFITYPYVVIVFAYLVDLILTKFASKNAIVGPLIFLLLLGLPAFMSIKNAFVLSRSDTRVELYNWFKLNLPRTDVVLYKKSDYGLVLDKFPNIAIKNVTVAEKNVRGLLITDYDPTCDCVDVPLAPFDGAVKKVAQIDNFLRAGPILYIYSLNK